MHVLRLDVAAFLQTRGMQQLTEADLPGDLLLRKPMTGGAGCARDAHGDAAIAPISAMISRRLIRSPRMANPSDLPQREASVSSGLAPGARGPVSEAS